MVRIFDFGFTPMTVIITRIIMAKILPKFEHYIEIEYCVNYSIAIIIFLIHLYIASADLQWPFI